jgi:hypothetical protein
VQLLQVLISKLNSLEEDATGAIIKKIDIIEI